MLNKRPFSVAGVSSARVGTVGDLLNTLGLEARVLKHPLTLKGLYAGLVESTIDYGAVESRLAPYRSRMDAYISNITALATLKMRGGHCPRLPLGLERHFDACLALEEASAASTASTTTSTSPLSSTS